MRTPTGWISTALGEHIDLLTGFPFKSAEYTDDPAGIPLLRGANVSQGRLDWSGAKRWPFERTSEFKPFLLQSGDVVLAMDRPWIEAGLKYGWITSRDLPCLLVQRVARMRGTNGLLTAYLRCLIGSKAFTDYIAPIVTGVTVPHISPTQIRGFRFNLPPVHVQSRIVSVLSAYDDLIENNRLRIELLEQMARALYWEWFVRFRYPGHEGLPLEYSDLGPIPRGWRVRSIADLAAPQKYAVTSGPFGSRLGRKDYVESGVPVIRGTNLMVGGRFRDSDFVYVSASKADELQSCIAVPGDILVTQRGTLGQVGLIPASARHKRYVLSQSQMKVTVDNLQASHQYIYAVLRSEAATKRIQSMAMTAGVPHINLTMLRESAPASRWARWPSEPASRACGSRRSATGAAASPEAGASPTPRTTLSCDSEVVPVPVEVEVAVPA